MNRKLTSTCCDKSSFTLELSSDIRYMIYVQWICTITFFAWECSFQPTYAVFPMFEGHTHISQSNMMIALTWHSCSTNIDRPGESMLVWENLQPLRTFPNAIFLHSYMFSQPIRMASHTDESATYWAFHRHVRRPSFLSTRSGPQPQHRWHQGYHSAQYRGLQQREWSHGSPIRNGGFEQHCRQICQLPKDLPNKIWSLDPSFSL